MIRLQGVFRAAGIRTCNRTFEPKPVASEPKEWCYPESCAQVESLVAPNSGGGLKPGGSTMVAPRDRAGARRTGSSARRQRPTPLAVRFSAAELKTIHAKARAAGCTTNGFIRASSLGSDYRPPVDPELTKALLRVYRELAAQGNNLNQIARQLNAGITLPAQGAVLDALTCSIRDTLRQVRDVLANGGPETRT